MSRPVNTKFTIHHSRNSSVISALGEQQYGITAESMLVNIRNLRRSSWRNLWEHDSR